MYSWEKKYKIYNKPLIKPTDLNSIPKPLPYYRQIGEHKWLYAMQMMDEKNLNRLNVSTYFRYDDTDDFTNSVLIYELKHDLVKLDNKIWRFIYKEFTDSRIEIIYKYIWLEEKEKEIK